MSSAENTNLKVSISDAIRELNDTARNEIFLFEAQKSVDCRVVCTHGVMEKYRNNLTSVLGIVHGPHDFTEDSDPRGEHDMAFFQIGKQRLMWKFDYYDKTLRFASEDPSSNEFTRRVLTILLASEY